MDEYYELPIDIQEIFGQKAGVSLEDVFYVKNLQQRKIYIEEDITVKLVEKVTRNILQFNAADKGIPVEDRKPIMIYLSSDGGDVDAGFELIDAIEASKTPVYTINRGYWYSMGCLIGISGHKRYAFKNAKLLMHDGKIAIINSNGKAQDIMAFNQKMEERTKAHVLSHGNIDEEQYDKKTRYEWYMFADEAQEFGFIDYIIGKDCDLDEVI